MMGDMTASSSGTSVPGEGALPHPDATASGATASGQELADLLRRCARGDEAAFAELYDATSRRLFGLVLRIARGHAPISDRLGGQSHQRAAPPCKARRTALS